MSASMVSSGTRRVVRSHGASLEPRRRAGPLGGGTRVPSGCSAAQWPGAADCAATTARLQLCGASRRGWSATRCSIPTASCRAARTSAICSRTSAAAAADPVASDAPPTPQPRRFRRSLSRRTPDGSRLQLIIAGQREGHPRGLRTWRGGNCGSGDFDELGRRRIRVAVKVLEHQEVHQFAVGLVNLLQAGVAVRRDELLRARPPRDPSTPGPPHPRTRAGARETALRRDRRPSGHPRWPPGI